MNRREMVKTLVVLPAAATLPIGAEVSDSWISGPPPPKRPGEFLVTDDTFRPLGTVVDEWKAAQPVDSVWVHCRGGGALEGFFLANAIQTLGIPVHVAGLALGIAALLPILAARSSMHLHGFLYLMSCWATAVGPAEMRRTADLLEKIDASKARVIAESCTRRGHDTEPAQVLKWMSENTWFNAQEALEAGLISEISDTPPPRVFREDTRHSAG